MIVMPIHGFFGSLEVSGSATLPAAMVIFSFNLSLPFLKQLIMAIQL